MTRREISFLVLGLTAGAIATVFATESASARPARLGRVCLGVAARRENRERRTPRDLRCRHRHGGSPRNAHHHARMPALHRTPRTGIPMKNWCSCARASSKRPSTASSHKAPAGSVIFYASNDLHGMRNAGDGQASYFVLALDVTRQGRTQARRIAVNETARPDTPRLH